MQILLGVALRPAAGRGLEVKSLRARCGRMTRYSELSHGPILPVAVGTTIADRPPHRSVQARLRIRLLSGMSGGKAGIRIRMQNTGLRNPPVQERDETIPSHLGALTATD